MKNLKITFFAIASLICTTVSATDIYVRDMGAGGAYSTISAAITAASDGDRIIIKPKAGGIPYLENLTINKTLSFVSETANARYLVQGTVSITPAVGRIVTINNLQLSGAFSTTANSPAGGRTTVNIANSTFSSTLNAGFNNTTLNLAGSTVTSTLSFEHGKITGNTTDLITITDDTGDILATTHIYIIANKVKSMSIQSAYVLNVLNNIVYSPSSYAVFVSKIKTGSTNIFQNNSISNISTTNDCIEIGAGTETGSISFLNNIITNTTFSSYVELHNNSTNTNVYLFYNLTGNNYALNTVGVTSAASNISAAAVSVNTTTGVITGTAHINAGYPEPEYQDLDLTLNDIGHFGGSDSWNNYWPTNTTGKPQVFFLDTPRRVYPGTTTIDASGMGYSK